MPASLLSILRSMAVSVLRMVTDAPGTKAPEGSVRVPVMVAEPAFWGKAGPAKTASRASRERTIKLVWRINVSSQFKRVKNVLQPAAHGFTGLPVVKFKRSLLASIVAKPHERDVGRTPLVRLFFDWSGPTRGLAAGQGARPTLEHKPQARLGPPGVGAIREAGGRGTESRRLRGASGRRGGSARGYHEVGRGQRPRIRRREARRADAGGADRVGQVKYLEQEADGHFLPEAKRLGETRVEARDGVDAQRVVGQPWHAAVAAKSIEAAGECLEVGHVGGRGEADRFVSRPAAGQGQQAV